MKLLITLLSLLLFTTSAEAQFGKKLVKNISKKVGQKVEDKMVDELSEEIARRAVKPLDNVFDQMFRESYKAQYGEDYDDSKYNDDPEKRARMMEEMLASMYGQVDLPPSYDFAYTVTIKVTDYGEKKSNDLLMLIDPSGKAFGMMNMDGKDEHIMIFDIDQDQAIIFNEKEQTAMAIPNVMSMTRAMTTAHVEQNGEAIHFDIQKINKTKKVSGYQSQGYKVTTTEDEGEFYMTSDLPFTWSNSFGRFAEQISPNFHKQNPEYDTNGMLMYSEMRRKDDGKKSKWEVDKVSDKAVSLDCTKYQLANGMR